MLNIQVREVGTTTFVNILISWTLLSYYRTLFDSQLVFRHIINVLVFMLIECSVHRMTIVFTARARAYLWVKQWPNSSLFPQQWCLFFRHFLSQDETLTHWTLTLVIHEPCVNTFHVERVRAR
uniref:Uncharacterized protein n=1 Tax=Cacopsylla melanoneura TaxID=428564 RepID=A0A8D8LC04_9HEMI